MTAPVLDLLAPMGAEAYMRDNYVRQVRQTIGTYGPSFIFLGEAVQNALDAVRESDKKTHGRRHRINIELDFDARRVTVRDTGDGFPNKPELLFLGGGTKVGKNLAGMVGVGLKVVLFSSVDFSLRARSGKETFRVDIPKANQSLDKDPPSICLPSRSSFQADPAPLPHDGTEITYAFPDADGSSGIPEKFLRDMREECLQPGKINFERSLENAVKAKIFRSRLAALIAADLRRYSYVGSTELRPDLAKTTITVTVKGSERSLGNLWELADNQAAVTFEVEPSYLTVHDTVGWAKPPHPSLQNNPLEAGGTGMTKVQSGFNRTRYVGADQLEMLITDSMGRKPASLDHYRRKLFGKIRSIELTIGRIPQFSQYLPGGARRVISSRGVVTQHDIEITSGQNQQYVRCFDIVVDVDADLNYGKTHLTDTHLVANVRSFMNDAYRCSIQNAARNYVGKVKNNEPTESKFWARDDLGIDELSQKKVPYDENDVISLWFELSGLGKLPGYEWYGLSSQDTYDARCLVLGATKNRSGTENDLLVVEFKLRGASVARDFDRGDKDVSRVDLVICYEAGTPALTDYQLIEVRDSDLGQAGGEGAHPHVTHVLLHNVTGKEVQVIELKGLLDLLFSPQQSKPLPQDVQDTD